MIETYYEQNTTMSDPGRNKKKKIVFRVFSYVNLVIGLLFLMLLGLFIQDADGNFLPALWIVLMVSIPVIFIASFFLIRNYVMKINLEYDYILNGSNLIIVKIINKIKRKKFLEFDITEFGEIGKVTLPSYNQHMAGKPKEYNVCSNINDDNYYIVTKYNGEKAIIYTEFDEGMLSAITRTLGRNLLKKK